MEFPVLFLGETAGQYSGSLQFDELCRTSRLGTWYPKGGMHEIIKGMVKLAEEKGVQIKYDAEVEEIEIENGIAHSEDWKSGERIKADIVVAGADYHHVRPPLNQSKIQQLLWGILG